MTSIPASRSYRRAGTRDPGGGDRDRKDAGFSLEELRELFAAPDRNRRREVLLARLAQVRQLIARLTLTQTLLEHASRCQEPDYQSCPDFQAMVLARLDGMDLAQAWTTIDRSQVPAVPGVQCGRSGPVMGAPDDITQCGCRASWPAIPLTSLVNDINFLVIDNS